jgi:hypothetical protein
MTSLSRRLAVLLTLAATSGCSNQRLTKCQEFTSSIARTGSAIMWLPLDAPRFESTLTAARADVVAFSGIPELEQAKTDYEKKMREAIALATKASTTTTRVDLVNANATARAQAAQATYYLMETTNLHCAGER